MSFDKAKRTFAYVDGFNLYHRALQRTPYRWIDPKALLEKVVKAPGSISHLMYYTARVSSKIDGDAPKKQKFYLDALDSLPGVEKCFGSFQVRGKWRQLANPATHFRPTPQVVKVVNPEEKGSDVNLGAHLVRDAFQGKFSQAVVCTNDTDLCEPIRIVVEEVGLPVILVTPSDRSTQQSKREPIYTPKDLINAAGGAGFVYHMRRNHMRSALLPDPVVLPSGKSIPMPPTWAKAAQLR
ncbi:NYN domain-containing protein [uncultured Tateyamaria sp.]|uniref:NYN domain-containing protein n=1 Tax=uncultured Tateyamaria sp. TaxID=455651 RepID=UPI00262E3E8C|nr:NYN domain-containing protein [uncultured Tateyamaria sp.]